MDAHEWYDNYYCEKCKQRVHENHNIPKHECKLKKFNWFERFALKYIEKTEHALKHKYGKA